MKSIGNLILRFLFGGKFKKQLEKISDEADDYHEYESALMSLQTHLDAMPDLIKRGDDAIKRLEADTAERKKRIAKLKAMKFPSDNS